MAKTPLSHSGHVVSIWTYALTLIVLLVLMFTTVAVSFVDMPNFLGLSGNFWNNAIAIAIASMKAIFVILIFMGVKWSSNTARLWMLAGFTWFTLMYVIMLDYGTRKWEQPMTSHDVGAGITDPWGGGPETALPREIQQGSPNLPDSSYENVRPRQ